MYSFDTWNSVDGEVKLGVNLARGNYLIFFWMTW